MKKRIALLLALLLMLCGAACAERAYWPDTSAPIVCLENTRGCQILQMIMMGCFDGMDPDDSLSTRVFAAAYPDLCALTQEDFDHFLSQFDEDADFLERCYYIALANCLWADIIVSDYYGDERYVRRVLLLFLNPDAEQDADGQMEYIRSNTDENTIMKMAQVVGASEDFIEYLIYSDDWRSLDE